jgi:hypothetical protein
MKIEIIGTGMGPILSSKKLDELFFGTSTINRKNPLEEAMDKLLNEVKCDNEEKCEAPICFDIQSITANHKKNAFTVVWGDGSHTIVHLQKGDVWDDEKALAMCFTKKALGNKGNFNDKFNDVLDNKMKVIPAEKADGGTIKMSDSSISFTRPITLNEEAVKRMTEALEKACDCDGTCDECECKAEAEKFIEEIEALKKRKNAFGVSEQTVTKLSKAANKASSSLKDMINALTNEVASKTSKVENTPLYRVFVRISGKTHHDSDFTSIEALRQRVHEIAEEHYGRKPYYYRTWMGDSGRMIMDFGHYTKFIEIEGITPDEYAKN